MTKKKIEKLLDKYLNGSCNDLEKKILEDFLDSYQNDLPFWTKPEHGNKFNLQESLYNEIIKKNKLENKPHSSNLKKNRYTFIKYAAVFLISLFSVFMIKTYQRGDKDSKLDDSNEIILELSNGTKKTINRNNSDVILNSKGIIQGKYAKGKIVYENTEETTNVITLSYNKLFVPHGEKIQVVLSDGSIVYLNSGSNLKYPVQFIKGEPREIYLDGEAYFNIAKNNKDTFIVHANDINTRVYGTEFNITSYKNDDTLEVVLVEGSLGVNAEGKFNKKEVLLVPNEKASFDKIERQITTMKVNVEKHIAWKDGVLYFEKERFENIARKLERHYNISIQNNNRILKNTQFTGTFDIETIDEVLEVFSHYFSFQYVINNNIIIIN
ncbi:MAG: FecR family protein [Cellulophaga sp.]